VVFCFVSGSEPNERDSVKISSPQEAMSRQGKRRTNEQGRSQSEEARGGMINGGYGFYGGVVCPSGPGWYGMCQGMCVCVCVLVGQRVQAPQKPQMKAHNLVIKESLWSSKCIN